MKKLRERLVSYPSLFFRLREQDSISFHEAIVRQRARVSTACVDRSSFVTIKKRKRERKKKERGRKGKHDEQPCLTLDEAWNIARNGDGDVALCETTLVDVGKIKIHPLFVLHPPLRDTDAWQTLYVKTVHRL